MDRDKSGHFPCHDVNCRLCEEESRMDRETREKLPIETFQTAGAWFEAARMDVLAAMRFSLDTHGMPTTDPVRGALNLCEEAGEVAEEALDATRPVGSPFPKITHLRSMVEELAQAAGYAILLMQQMKGEIYKLEKGAQRGEQG